MPDIRKLSDKALELAESGQYEKAFELVNREIKIDANNASAWYTKGILLFKMCRYQDARNSFAQAADIDPALLPARNRSDSVRRTEQDQRGAAKRTGAMGAISGQSGAE